MIKNLFVFCFLIFLIPSNCFGQVILKKKYFGTYTGEIASYYLDGGDEIIQVSSCQIKVTLQANGSFFQEINDQKRTGSWSVFFETDRYIVLEVKIEGQEILERIQVFKKGKKLIREGIFPQPNALLNKQKG
jgi:hypothetical protein